MRELSLTNCRLEKRYDVLRRLGQGSYAEIFVARDLIATNTSPHNTVVIKALNVFLQDDIDPDLERTLVENFQNEAIALDRVRHPNIISRLGHGTARDLAGTIFHYLVLEYLPGGDLQKAAREERPPLKKALGYIEQVCAGLKHAHRHDVIHRDVKPQNLLLTADRETVKIADFGVARIHLSDAPITRVGTNVYAPPEHSPLNTDGESNGSNPKLTPASDIYSLAKSMYALVCGESPRFYAGHQVTALPLLVRNERWAEEVLRVLRRATEPDPGRRHQSVDEFWSDLEPVRRIALEGEVTTRLRVSLHDTPQPHVSRGYSPLAPQQPRFDTSRDLKLRAPAIGQTSRLSVDVIETADAEAKRMGPMQRVEDYWPEHDHESKKFDTFEENRDQAAFTTPGKLRRFLRGVAPAALFIVVFTLVLYGTSVFLRGVGILPRITNPFAYKTGRANTDVNLRPDPSINNEPIGLVTRNSRVRIVKIQNNWYQVDILEQGRPRDQQVATTNRGWLNGRYIDLD